MKKPNHKEPSNQCLTSTESFVGNSVRLPSKIRSQSLEVSLLFPRARNLRRNAPRDILESYLRSSSSNIIRDIPILSGFEVSLVLTSPRFEPSISRVSSSNKQLLPSTWLLEPNTVFRILPPVLTIFHHHIAITILSTNSSIST